MPDTSDDPTPGTLRDRGCDEDGYLLREGSLERVPDAFRPVVAELTAEVGRVFGDGRLHSAYVYGSLPRGTAVPGVSDLDVLLALRAGPTEKDRADASALLARLDARFPQIDGGGLLLFSAATLLDESENYDMGWFVACLCTPLLGPDLARRLPRYRPTSRLAREANGDLARDLPRLADRVAAAGTDAERLRLCRSLARRLVRTGFTLVMPRWGGWTSDLDRMAEICAGYYPDHADQLHTAARWARSPTADPAALRQLITGLAPWLAREYQSRHGKKPEHS